ncbi:MAG: hypothetical protein WAV78_26110, partial [Xanthobacteraceae bacterium]
MTSTVERRSDFTASMPPKPAPTMTTFASPSGMRLSSPDRTTTSPTLAQDRAAIERLKMGRNRPAFSSINEDLDWRGGLHNTAAMLNCGSSGWRALGQAVLIYLVITSSAATAQDSQPGRATFAEMVAFARLGSVACQRLAPDVEGFHALALLRLIKPPLTDKAIVAKEKEVKRLRDRLGL